MIVMVTYDLKTGDESEYEDLYTELKKTPYRHDLESTWLLETDETPQQVWTRIKPHIDKDDTVLVNALQSPVAGWLIKSTWEWINARL